MKQVILAVEVYQEGTNLGRLEGFRLIVEALGGAIQPLRATPVFDEYWCLDIPVRLPPEKMNRCKVIAERLFDGRVTVRESGSWEGPDTPLIDTK